MTEGTDTDCLDNNISSNNIFLYPMDKNKQNSVNSSSRKFIPPTVEEVKKYCIERKNNVNAETFVDFYTAKDWLIGKNKMKDWKAAVRYWEKSRSGYKEQEYDYPVVHYETAEPIVETQVVTEEEFTRIHKEKGYSDEEIEAMLCELRAEAGY